MTIAVLFKYLQVVHYKKLKLPQLYIKKHRTMPLKYHKHINEHLI